MRSMFRSLFTVLTLGIAALIGCTAKKPTPPSAPLGPNAVTLLVPAMN